MQSKEQSKSMIWLFFALGAALSWGIYGVVLHKGQVALGNPLKALLCVGVAYCLMGVLVPIGVLVPSGALNNFNEKGVMFATFGGLLGALGAVCIIWAFRNGGSPAYVMPLVFGVVGAALGAASLFWVMGLAVLLGSTQARRVGAAPP